MKEPPDRLLPHAHDSERGILGCILLDPKDCLPKARQRIESDTAFYDLRNRTVWNTLCQMANNGGIDTILLEQHLNEDGNMVNAGGAEYVHSLPDAAASPASLPYHLEIVREKWIVRRAIISFTETASRLFDEPDFKSILSDANESLTKSLSLAETQDDHERWSVHQLMAYDVQHDPNAVIGLRDGKTTRYLCKGYGAWMIGQSGIGKSSLSLQQAFLFALNRPFCGITPMRALRVLVVQSENDIGDNAETTQGVMDCIPDLTTTDVDQLQDRVVIRRCRGRTGHRFCQWLEREIMSHRADLTYIDPLLRFAGIDVSRQDQCTQFLNNCLDPVLARTGVVLIGAHHTGKPKSKQDTKNQTVYDMAYAGIGSSELVNWARAITILEAMDEGVFRLILSKRGQRAFATHPDGQNSTVLYLKHGHDKVFWTQTDPPESQQPRAQGKPAGRKNKVEEIATSNLHDFCAACIPDGEGLNDIAARLERTLAKNRIDASTSTCKRIIPALVANGKLTKTDTNLYVKGPQA